ncbi:hypothetical protein OROMI_033845 [Orobanche minor]
MCVCAESVMVQFGVFSLETAMYNATWLIESFALHVKYSNTHIFLFASSKSIWAAAMLHKNFNKENVSSS